jgi:predicted metal-dependent hydrolase
MTGRSAGYQMNLGFQLIATELEELLANRLGRSVKLTLTRNSSSMLSAQLREGRMHIRLHEAFLRADADLIDEIADFIRDKRNRIPLFRKFIKDNAPLIHQKTSRKITVRTSGRHHDIAMLYDEVNREYFQNRIDVKITWGTGRTGLWVRKRTLGSYSSESNLIRINPVLDSSRVPRYYIKFVIFHEMLHAELGTPQKGARRCIHSAEFRRREMTYREYEKAVAWERKSGG